MNAGSFLKGMGLGMTAGAMVTLACMPRKKPIKNAAGKALKSMGDVIESVSEALGR